MLKHAQETVYSVQQNDWNLNHMRRGTAGKGSWEFAWCLSAAQEVPPPGPVPELASCVHGWCTVCSASGHSWEWKSVLSIVPFGKTNADLPKKPPSDPLLQLPASLEVLTTLLEGCRFVAENPAPRTVPVMIWLHRVASQNVCQDSWLKLISNRETISVLLPTFWFPFRIL